MTRVALLPSSYPPALGGVEELTRHLALALVDAGDEVEVWTPHGDDAQPETVEVRDDLIVRRFPMPLPAVKWSSLYRSATIGPRTLFSLRNAVDAFRPDVLNVVCFGPNGAYATTLARFTGLPLVVSLHGETVMDDADIFETSRVLRRALRRGLRAAAAVTACSAFTLADAERRFGLAPGRGSVIPSGVDLAGVHSAGADGVDDPPSTGSEGQRAPGHLPAAGRPYVLALGRVVHKKGFDLLVEAYAGIGESRRTADLVVGGTGPALEELRSRAETLGLRESVHFPGRLSRSQVTRYMAGADLFVLPSRVEPFGIVILEAWRAGVAVVATDRGGPPELVRDGVDGVLVDPFDTTSFTEAIEGILTDDTRRSAVAAAGRARVAEFAWPVVVERYRSLYASVTASREAAGGPDHGLSVPHQGESVS